MNKVYELITDTIISSLEQGTVPWRKPWSVHPGMRPQNAISKRAYTGINPFLLSLRGYTDPRWLTYKQLTGIGGNVKGQKSTKIIFWKVWNKTNDDGDEKTFRVLRYYNVFNVEQVTRVDFPKIEIETPKFTPIQVADEIITNTPNRPTMLYDGGDRAYYRPSTDEIHLPTIQSFDSNEEFYSTAFHELSHSTGHPSRLNRHEFETGIAAFGSPVYSREELVAEFANAFLCATSGIETTIHNSTAYIQGWSKKLRRNPELIIQCASQGQKAADYILGY